MWKQDWCKDSVDHLSIEPVGGKGARTDRVDIDRPLSTPIMDQFAGDSVHDLIRKEIKLLKKIHENQEKLLQVLVVLPPVQHSDATLQNDQLTSKSITTNMSI